MPTNLQEGYNSNTVYSGITVIMYIGLLWATVNGARMNRFLSFGGLIVVLISLLIFTKTFEKYKVSRSGKIVEVVLLKLPSCTGYKNNFVTFEYKQREYIQRVKCKYLNQIEVGDRVEMFHIEDTKTFLFKEENVDFDIAMLLTTATLMVKPL